MRPALRALLFLSLASACAPSRGAASPPERRPDASDALEKDPDDAEARPLIERSMLERNTVIEGVPCLGHFQIGRYANGALAFCNTTRAFERDGVIVRADSYTRFFPDGRLEGATLAAPKTFQVGDVGEVGCAAADATFRSDGMLRGCTLDVPFVAPEIRCAAGQQIWLRGDGAVRSCVLDEDMSAHGIDLPKGTSVQRTPKGDVRGASFQEQRMLRGVCVESDVVFWPNGAFASLTLPIACTVQGNELPRGAKLSFRATGTLRSACYLKLSGRMPHGEPREVTVIETFDAAGKPIEKSELDDALPDPPPPRYRPIR